MNGGRSRTSLGNLLISTILLMMVVVLILALTSSFEKATKEIPIPIKVHSQ